MLLRQPYSTELTDLTLNNCKKLKELPVDISRIGLRGCKRLAHIDLNGCLVLTFEQGFDLDALTELTHLYLAKCPAIEALPLHNKGNHESLPSLVHLDLSNCGAKVAAELQKMFNGDTRNEKSWIGQLDRRLTHMRAHKTIGTKFEIADLVFVMPDKVNNQLASVIDSFDGAAAVQTMAKEDSSKWEHLNASDLKMAINPEKKAGKPFITLVDAAWLLKIAEGKDPNRKIIPRHQELPPEAHVTLEEMERWDVTRDRAERAQRREPPRERGDAHHDCHHEPRDFEQQKLPRLAM